MHSEPDVTRIVRSWLRTDEHESADRVLDSVLILLDTTPQRQARWSARRISDMHTYAKLAIGAAAVVVVAIVGINLLPASSEDGGSSTAVSPGPSPSPSPAIAPQPSPSPEFAPTPGSRFIGDGKVAIDPGPHDLRWPLGPSGGRIALTVPAGWWRTGDDLETSDDTSISTGAGRVYQPKLGVAVHAVSHVVASVCASDVSSDEVGPILTEVGPTVDDLTGAIGKVVGTHWSNPEDVTLGGYPAKRLVTTFSSADCPGPPRRWIWASAMGWFFVEDGLTSTIYVVDVNGHRLVLTSDERDASPDDVTQLHAVIDSIHIEGDTAFGGTATPSPAQVLAGSFPMAVGPDADLRIGRHTAIVDGVRFSFQVPKSNWEPQLGFYISKSFTGPQGAEGILRWSTFPDSLHVDPCPDLLDPPGPSASGLAAAVATAPGTDLVSGPSDVTVGGRAAKHMVLTVRDDVGCDPGFFYSYDPIMGGAMWTHTRPGDTIAVWIVDVDGTILFIEGETHDSDPAVDQIQEIVDSIRFD